jgi:hypothetical protein
VVCAAERIASRRVLPAHWFPAHKAGVPAQGAHLGASLSLSPPAPLPSTPLMTIITTTTTPLTSSSSWCRISWSMALPRLVAVSPSRSILNSRSKGLHSMKASEATGVEAEGTLGRVCARSGAWREIVFVSYENRICT